jgi:hypothetical protein
MAPGMAEEDATVRTTLGTFEELAGRHGLKVEDLEAAVRDGELKTSRQPGDPRILLAERDVLVWMATRARRFHHL